MKRYRHVPLLFTVFAVLVCSALGLWQLQRLQWKEALLAEIESAQQQPPLMTLPQEVEGLAFRNVALTGRYEGKTLRFVGRKSGGYIHYAPLKLADGRALLASLGWYASAEEVTPPQGQVMVKGVLRPPRAKRLFSPRNFPEKNLWFTADIPAMEEASGQKLLPVLLDNELPVQRNDHLGYAITWFLIAAAAVVMYGFYRRQPQQR